MLITVLQLPAVSSEELQARAEWKNKCFHSLHVPKGDYRGGTIGGFHIISLVWLGSKVAIECDWFTFCEVVSNVHYSAKPIVLDGENKRHFITLNI